MDATLTLLLLGPAPLLLGWIADRLWGDPLGLPHPVVGFGRLIAAGERRWNQGAHRRLKGAMLAAGLIAAAWAATKILLACWRLTAFTAMTLAPAWVGAVLLGCTAAIESALVFYSLAGKTLIDEVREVFRAVDRSVEEGRRQVGRIVGRDTSALTPQEIRTAALETLAENLSDGVVAPLFWLAVLGIPGMVAYKMVNTLDSMIGYRTERYARFGCAAARIDDAANWIPARLTALLMLLAAGRPGLWRFVLRFGPRHASPNSGWPEAALAGILGCRFGGTHDYFGEAVYKPHIGTDPRMLTAADMERAVGVNRRAEVLAVVLTAAVLVLKTRILLG